jgi:dihydrofolate reductase
MRNLTYLVATSVDGFIADPDGGLDHMVVSPELVAYLAAEYPETLPTPAREAMGVTAPNRSFDTVIQGRHTYQLGLDAGVTSPYGHLRQYVASRSLTSPDPAVTVVADPLAAVRALKAEEGLGIYLAGGGELAGLLLPEIDEIVVKVYPVVAGAGVPLLGGGFRPRPLRLRDSRVLDCGTAVLRYVPA